MIHYCSKILALAFILFFVSPVVLAKPSVSSPKLNASQDVTAATSPIVARAGSLTLDSAGDVTYKPGEVLGEATFQATPSETFVLSADKYELQNDGGEIKISAFQLEEATTSAKTFELSGSNGKFTISTAGKGFSLIDNGEITAKTDLPLVVKKSSRSLWLITPTGEKEIKVTPSQVLIKLVKDGVLSRVELMNKEVSFSDTGRENVTINENGVQILDSSSGAYYTISGEKDFRALGMIPLTFSVNVRVDVSNGRVLAVNQPWFLDKLGFLFSKN